MFCILGVTDTDRKSSVKTFLCGVTAGCMASFITHPADVIKTYAQLHPAEFSRISSGLIFIHQVSLKTGKHCRIVSFAALKVLIVCSVCRNSACPDFLRD